MLDYSTCSGCSGKAKPFSNNLYPGLAVCSDCGGLIGNVYLVTYRAIVQQEWSKQEGFDGAVYFDFYVIDVGARYHGWVDQEGKLLQTG